MRYEIKGIRLSGKEIDNIHTDIKLAEFDFGCLKDVSQWCTMYKVDDNNKMQQLDLYIRQ